MTLARPLSPFGLELRRWRQSRGRSQLDLATLAGTTPRHLSFLETGRSRPSRELVLRLAGALDVPLRDRNRLLVAAGLPAAFAERRLDDAEMEPVRRVVDALLARHEPFPGLVIDASYRVLRANGAAQRMLGPLSSGDWLDAVFAPGSPLGGAIENFAEVAWASYDMMRQEAFESGRTEPCQRLAAHLAAVPRPATLVEGRPPAVIAPRFRFGERVVSTLTTIARFGTARDVAADELRVELIFPADDDSARFFEELAAAAG